MARSETSAHARDVNFKNGQHLAAYRTTSVASMGIPIPPEPSFTMRFHSTLVLLALLLSLTPRGAMAQGPATSSPSSSVPFKEEKVGDHELGGMLGKVVAEGATAGVAIVVDATYAARHENSPPDAPFKFTAPKGRDLRMLAGGKKTGAPELVRITLPAAEGKVAAEILRFGTIQMPKAPAAERLASAVTLLRTSAFPMFTRGYENAKVLDIYTTKVRGNDAAVMHMEMTQPGTGETYFVKAIAILHPTRQGGVMGFLMADKMLSEIKTGEDLASKGVGIKIIHSVEFLEE